MIKTTVCPTSPSLLKRGHCDYSGDHCHVYRQDNTTNSQLCRALGRQRGDASFYSVFNCESNACYHEPDDDGLKKEH